MTELPDRHIPAPHPACLAEDELLRQCSLRQTRRGGPGGQHRNKVSTTIVLMHEPTGIIAEASERRSQADNRRIAIRRLRELLAIRIRTQRGVEDGNADRRKLVLDQKLRFSEKNPDRPAVLALLLDDIEMTAGDTRMAAELWETTSSQVVRFLKLFPEALGWVNRLRVSHNQRPLK